MDSSICRSSFGYILFKNQLFLDEIENEKFLLQWCRVVYRCIGNTGNNLNLNFKYLFELSSIFIWYPSTRRNKNWDYWLI